MTSQPGSKSALYSLKITMWFLWNAYFPILLFGSCSNWLEVNGMSVKRKGKAELQHFGHLNDQGKQSTPLEQYEITQTKIDLIKRSVERNPLDIWFFKDRFRSEQDQQTFSLFWNSSIVSRGQTTRSLKNVIRRSLQGENIDTVIMGGSISAGGGLNYDREDLRGVYYRVFADWWQKAIQPLTGSSVKLHNLAVGGTGSNFFAFCYRTLLNPGTDIDLAFLDFTVNDYLQFSGSKFPTALPLEQLIREVLSEKKSPPIFFIDFVRGVSKSPTCNNLENHGQTVLAQNYGITSITLRKFFCLNPSNGKNYPRMFASDGNHPSILSHAQVALLIINYVRKTILEVIDTIAISKQKSIVFNNFSTSLGDLPKPVFRKNLREFLDKPRCFTQILPDATKNSSLHQTLQVREIGNFGFQVLPKTFINQPGQVNPVMTLNDGFQKFRTDAYRGWKANSMGSLLELEIFLPLVKLSPMDKRFIIMEEPTRSVAIAVRTHNNGANARVWIDEFEENGVLINTSSMYGHTKLHTIVQHATQGRHVLSVRTTTAGVFTLVGVMIGPVYK